MSFLRHLSLLSPLRLATLQPPTRALKPRKPRKCECIIHFSPILQKGVGTPPSVSPFWSFPLPSSPLFFIEIQSVGFIVAHLKNLIFLSTGLSGPYISAGTHAKSLNTDGGKRSRRKGLRGKCMKVKSWRESVVFSFMLPKSRHFYFFYFFSLSLET